VTGLSLLQLDEIFSRYPRRGGKRVEFWREVGVTGPLADQLITRVVLGKVHGSHDFFREVVMRGADFQFDSTFERLGSALAQSVGAQDTSIGFASVMFATARTRFVPLQAADGSYVLPTYENTTNGRYPLVRPLWIVFNRKPDGSMNPVAREFLLFAVSRRGQRIIALAETYPITREQQKTALGVLKEAPAAR
jgi:phosphate transport system substrate-binding protein